MSRYVYWVLCIDIFERSLLPRDFLIFFLLLLCDHFCCFVGFVRC